jgi:hypothetical protein
MTDLKERLVAASRLVSPEPDGFERLTARRERRHRRQRVSAAVVALVLAAGAFVAASLAGVADLVGGDDDPDQGQAGDPASTPGPPQTGTGRGPDAFDATALALEQGTYYYQRVAFIFPGGRAEEETWWGSDASGRRRIVQESPNYGLGPEGVFGPGEFRYVESDLSDLPADPDGFLRALIERSSKGGRSPQAPQSPDPGGDPFSGELWHAVRRLVELPDFTPDLRATLFEVVQALPGAEVSEGATDPTGRPATLVSVPFGDEGVYRLHFDPDTRQVLAASETWNDGSEFYEIWVASGVMGSTNEAPGGDELLIPPPEGPLPTA